MQGNYNNNYIPNNLRGNSGYVNNGWGNNYGTTNQDDRFQWVDYVNGRAGADAYQLPRGVYKAILFDNDSDRFFVKQYDNNGRARIMEDNDFTPHVEPEPQTNVDMSKYPTKNDIRAMISEALGKLQLPNTSNFVTRDYFDDRLAKLAVGSGGKVVTIDEPNA